MSVAFSFSETRYEEKISITRFLTLLKSSVKVDRSNQVGLEGAITRMRGVFYPHQVYKIFSRKPINFRLARMCSVLILVKNLQKHDFLHCRERLSSVKVDSSETRISTFSNGSGPSLYQVFLSDYCAVLSSKNRECL